MTQLAKAKQNIITEEIKKASQNEPLSTDELKNNIEKGLVVIPKNINHDFEPVAVGKGTYIKVNANIGISNIKSTLENELLKLEAAVSAGAHSIMDLSVCNDLNHLRNIRKELIKKSPVMVGTVPIYEITCKVTSEKKRYISD